MKGFFLVEPVVALFAFSGALVGPLGDQYVYMRIGKELANTSYPLDNSTSTCAHNNTGNHSSSEKDVQKQASLFFLYVQLFSAIPSLVVTLILVAYSDQRGRKFTIILPVIGGLLDNLCFLTVSYFELNLYVLVGTSFVTSLFGGGGAFMGGCFAYVADLCDNDRQKTVRMSGLDMMIGLLSGVASLSTGYFLEAAGYNWPVITSMLGQCLTLLYAVFLLEETVKQTPAGYSEVGGADAPPRRSAVKQMVFGIYQLFMGISRKACIRLVLLMLILVTFHFAYIGGLSSVILFELNEPLCWDAVLIGYGEALATTVFLTSFLGVWVFTYCRVPQLLVILLGVFSVMAGLTMMSFAKTTLFMFLVKIPLQLAIMPYPVLRTMMSKIVSTSEQGALFGCVVFVESLSTIVAGAVFSSIYAVTVAWFPGFSFLLAAGLCVIPIVLIGTVAMLKVDSAQEAEGFVSAEVEPSMNE